jgi:hypothetical protein
MPPALSFCVLFLRQGLANFPDRPQTGDPFTFDSKIAGITGLCHHIWFKKSPIG